MVLATVIDSVVYVWCCVSVNKEAAESLWEAHEELYRQ